MRIFRYSMVLMAAGLLACGDTESEREIEEELDVDGKAEAWNTANNPSYVDNTFIYDVASLPLSGETKQVPWSGDYWAAAKDSINHRWDGSNPSPAEKIAQAFNLADFPTWVTSNVGIYGHGTRACDTTSECSDLKDGSSCVKPRDATGDKAGRCTPGWWGICHGWAAAAIAEPQAVKTVEKNGVTFYPGDLEGIISFGYQSGLPTKFLSQRCNKKGDELGVDNNGRIREGECRDMNPGSMFIVLSNMLGLRGVGMVEDKTADYEVWNQPVRKFEVLNAENGKLKEITKAEAIQLLGGGLSFKNLLADAQLAKDEQQSGSFTADSTGEILFRLSGTGDGDLYVKKGAVPGMSDYDCRPYVSGSEEECSVQVAPGDVVYWMVNGYADSSKVTVAVGSPSAEGTEYIYNTKATKFYLVKMNLSYIVESRPAKTPPNPDSYTRTDTYDFILEADDLGKIIGGEWLGASMKKHPDFMWWPNGKPSSNQGGFTYAMVKELVDLASGGGTVEPETTTLIDDQYVRWYSRYASIGVPGGATLEVKMTGTGNADLYVRLGSKPTTNTFNCKSTNADSTESCTITAPESGGTYYVRARPRGVSSYVTVTATVTPAP